MAKDYTIFNITNEFRGELFHRQGIPDKLTKKSEFIVEDGEVAFLIKDGVRQQTLKGGRYEIFGKKDGLAGAFDKKRWATTRIAFVSNKSAKKIIKWGIPNREMEMRDPLTDIDFMMGAFGEMTIRVGSPEQFYEEWLTGKEDSFGIEDFQILVLAKLKEKARSAIIKTIKDRQLPYHTIDEYTEDIASGVRDILKKDFNEHYGIDVVEFIITKIAIPDDKKLEIRARFDEVKAEEKAELARLREKDEYKEVMAELERLRDKEFEKEKFLYDLRARDYQLYINACKEIGWPINQEQTRFRSASSCPECGAMTKPDDAFCPKCGQRQLPMTCQCGNSVPTDAAFCPKCGKATR